MATADSVKAKLQGLIAKANATTGNQDADLTTAVDALIAAIEAGGGGGTSAWGTFTPSSYAQTIPVGVEIPADNFYFAVTTISTPTKTTSNYIRCGYFVVQNGVTSGQLLGADGKPDYGQVFNSPAFAAVDIVIDRTNKTITFHYDRGTSTVFLEGGVTFAWFMGGIA